MYVVSVLSVIACFKFLTHKKTYEVYDFEQLYQQLGGRLGNSQDKFKTIKTFMENKFKEFTIEFIPRKRPEIEEEETHLDFF
jgi:hypothetical protein